MKIMRCFIIILVLFLCFVSCSEDRPPKLPLEIPFAVQNAGTKIEKELRIVEKRRYAFRLEFISKENDQADRDRIRKLVGYATRDKTGRYINTGIPVPLRLKVVRIDIQEQTPIFNKEISEFPVESWGWGKFSKNIADIMLDTGHYRVSVESLKNVPELEGTEIRFSIAPSYEGK